MTPPAISARKSFVLFPLGAKRFAVPADNVVELVGASFLHSFQHSNPLLLGVIVRRGRVVPVLDVARMLAGESVAERKFHLITKQLVGEPTGWTALPVQGECEIIADLETFPASAKHPPHVASLLLLVEEIVEVLDLERLAASLSAVPVDAEPLSEVEVHA